MSEHTCAGGHRFVMLAGVPYRWCPMDGYFARAWDWYFWGQTLGIM